MWQKSKVKAEEKKVEKMHKKHLADEKVRKFNLEKKHEKLTEKQQKIQTGIDLEAQHVKEKVREYYREIKRYKKSKEEKEALIM